MQITSLLFFAVLTTASRPGVRRRDCIQSPSAPNVQSTSTANASTTQVSPTPDLTTTVPEPFLLQIQASNPQSPPRYKRQELSGSYVEGDSSSSLRCEQGALFQLLNGRLLKDGIVVTVSDPPRPQPLLEASAGIAISITFSFTNSTLSWSNPRFPKQRAFFCLLADMVYVYFDAIPEGCVDVTLAFVSCESCLNFNLAYYLMMLAWVLQTLNHCFKESRLYQCTF